MAESAPDAPAPLSAEERAAAEIESVRLIVGMEVHVELRTRRKVFASAPSPAHPEFEGAAPNTLIDPVTLALPGALPVLNKAAVDDSILVGLALGCQIASDTKWDRKGYTYPDLPKGYQISQYDLPVCFDGGLETPAMGKDGDADFERDTTRIGIIRAHLEEDAGKLLHEAPGGARLDHSIVDLNRAGAALLEIVTQPEITSADQAVSFCKELRRLCRHLGATEGVMQKGHMRFEPNINCELRLKGGRLVRTPIVEVKNLNSFRAVKGAIEYELKAQPDRWRETGLEMGPGVKTTAGWDDARQATVPQREKEDAHDYRYFPDPDLPPVRIDEDWLNEVRSRLIEAPAARARRFVTQWSVSAQDARTLIEERPDADLFDEAVTRLSNEGMDPRAAAKACSNIMLQLMARLANERSVNMSDLGLNAEQVAGIAMLRAEDKIQSSNAALLVEKLADAEYAGRDPHGVAEYEGWLIVRDDDALDAWCDEVIEANGPIVEQIRSGKQQAIGRLIGEVMKKSGGSADAKSVRERLISKIG